MPTVTGNGIELYYETHGAEGGEPLLLIMGLGAQMTRWPAGRLNAMVSRPGVLLDWTMAQRREPTGATEVLSRLLVTVKVVRRRRDSRGSERLGRAVAARVGRAGRGERLVGFANDFIV